MEKINFGRVILGGIAAGLVGNVLGFLVDGVLLAPQWSEGMRAIGKPEFTASQNWAFTVIGFAYGLFTVWLYAAIRPRYGAGPKTAICAGFAVWAAGVLLPNITFMGIAGLFPAGLMLISTAAGIVEWVLAALAGAALYHEGAESLQAVPASR